MRQRAHADRAHERPFFSSCAQAYKVSATSVSNKALPLYAYISPPCAVAAAPGGWPRRRKAGKYKHIRGEPCLKQALQPGPSPFPLNPCLLPRSLANGRGEMCKRACETIAQASSPERCQRASPRNSHKQPRENIDLPITSPLQRIAARRARERHAQRHLANHSFARSASENFSLFPREARSEIFCTQSLSERTTPTKRKQTKKCERFPLRTNSREEEAAEKMRASPPAPRPPAKRK